MPPRRARPSPNLATLRELANDPPAQTTLAVKILSDDKDAQAIRAALDVLKQNPTPAARTALRERFEYYAADGVRRDAGTYLRAAILQALRPIARSDDLPLLERAAMTYEFLPPGRSEEGSLLRSAALVTLEAVEPRLAAWHAVRLLGDQYTSRLSGEPALTAVRVLAAQGNELALYQYALEQPNPHSDVLSECLKGLAGLPSALLDELIAKYGAAQDEVALVGLLDLLLERGGGHPFIRDVLDRSDQMAVYRYLLSRLVASPSEWGLAELAYQAQHERDAHKLSMLEEALSLGRGDPTLRQALADVRKRRAALRA